LDKLIKKLNEQGYMTEHTLCFITVNNLLFIGSRLSYGDIAVPACSRWYFQVTLVQENIRFLEILVYD
jgi:hypothetical protein